MSSFEFCIDNWCAWAPGIETLSDWQEWAKGEREIGEPGKPNLSAFPAMLRRRLSIPGKTAVHAALALDDASEPLNADNSPKQAQDIPAIFCSQYGEVARSSKLLKSLANSEALSPTDFSLSVHNAVAGVYSIGCSQKQNITSISAGPAGFVSAILEAVAILSNSEHHQVLCVIYDSPLPEPYPQSMNECHFPYAIAMLLGHAHKEEQVRASLLGDDERDRSQPEQFPAVGLLRFLADRQTTSIDVETGNALWRYERLGLGE
jgi:hypothetical protein